MVTKQSKKPRIGVQQNLILYREGRPHHGPSAEYPIYSDRSLVGNDSPAEPPYMIYGVGFYGAQGEVGVTAILRLTQCLELYREPINTNKSVIDTYHGGWLPDEVAALASLCLGVRLKAGPANRTFNYVGDPLGRYFAGRPQPKISFSYDIERAVLPSVLKTPNLQEVGHRLWSLDKLSDESAIALVKAARSYQEALWIAESAPHLAWLMLVTAVEIAASDYVVSSQSDEQNLRDFMPGLAQILDSADEDNLVGSVATELRNLFGSIRKFCSFLESFMPKAPDSRPEESYWCLDWEPAAMLKSLKTVYDLRSKALHYGRPFPAPMCIPGTRSVNGMRAEIAVTGDAVSTMGASWVPKDAPMTLDVFHHIVRGALLAWWDDACESANADV